MAVFKRLPGSSRRFVDLETGREYSRRAKEAIEGKQGKKRKPRANAKSVYNKQKLYYALRDSYIDKQAQVGKKIKKKQAMQSEEMKNIVKDLKSKDPFKKLQALKKTTRRDGVPDTIAVGETPSVYSGTM